MVSTVDQKLDHVLPVASRYYDVLCSKEIGNTNAKADVVVDGEVVMSGVPATFLLALEPRLKKLRDMLMAIPTLEPAIKWEPNASGGEGVYKSPDQISFAKEKTYKSRELSPATKEHPAQIRGWTEDMPVAKIVTQKTSGMWTPARKAEVFEKLDTLVRSIKQARQRASSVEVEAQKVSHQFFDFIF